MEHDTERITLARLPSGVEIATTVHTYEGATNGPTVYVQAAQHGQEINGTETLRRVHDYLTSADGSFAGRVVAVPVANPLTFDHVSYTTPEQLDSVNPNMNRVWPGDPEGTLHERMAARLWEYAGDADAIVDLHTGSPDMLTHVVFMEGHEASRELAEAFGTDLLLSEEAGDDADGEWAARDFGGKFRVAANEEGIPTITPELAHNKQIVEQAVEAGVVGTLNVLRHLGVLDEPLEANGDPTLARNHLGRVTADDSGLFRADPDRAVGDEVEEGDHLGTLYDATTFEPLQEAEADRDGILYSLAIESTVAAGDTLLNVAWRRE
jgi:predicted deacylase